MKALLLLPLLLASCSSVTHPDGTKLTALGGKGAYKSKAFTYVYDNQKSFRDGAVAVTALAASVVSAAATAASETTAQVASTNAANVSNTATKASTAAAINASNNATKTTLAEIAATPH